jgi:hypothetical protein
MKEDKMQTNAIMVPILRTSSILFLVKNPFSSEIVPISVLFINILAPTNGN